MKRFIWSVLLLTVGLTACRTRSATEEAKEEALEATSALFQCHTVAEGERAPMQSLRIVAQRPDHPRLKPSIYIAIGDGVRVKARCGERGEPGKKEVFACWYSGGGLTVSWPEKDPQAEALVRLERKRLFGAIGNAVHKLRCTREDTLEAVRQASL